MTKLSMLHGQVFIDVGHMSLFVGILVGFDISIFCNSQELISAWHRLGLSAESFLLYTQCIYRKDQSEFKQCYLDLQAQR